MKNKLFNLLLCPNCNSGNLENLIKKIMEHCSHFSDMKIGIARGTAMFGPYDNFNPKNCINFY